jgi:uncharacterized protein (TIGR03435 family)
MDDWQLLNEYATRQSETAFRTLVDRYSAMVYHAALRQVGNPHAAEEITQAVFVALAQKAGKISRHTVLCGWLFRATRFAVLNLVRTETTRQRHEQEAIAMEAANVSDNTETLWDQIAPHLNDALDRLSKADREVVMIRFFGNKSHKEVARVLGVSEDTAKKRVSRAIEKLRLIFARRGLVMPAVALMAAFTAFGAQAGPTGLAASVTTAAFAKGTTSSSLIAAKGILKLMAWTKTKTAIVFGAGILLTAGTVTVAVKEIQAHRTYDGPWQVKEIIRNDNLLRRMPPLVQIRPTQFTNDTGMTVVNGPRLAGLGQPLSRIVMWAYGYSAQDEYQDRVLFETELPPGKFDFIDTATASSGDALKQEIKNQFDLVGRYVTQETNVLLLTVKRPHAPGLMPHEGKIRPGLRVQSGHITSYKSGMRSLNMLAQLLENDFFKVPVFDQTGLRADIDFDLAWDDGDPEHHNLDNLKQALLDQLGLELVPATKPVQMLVVKKASH